MLWQLLGSLMQIKNRKKQAHTPLLSKDAPKLVKLQKVETKYSALERWVEGYLAEGADDSQFRLDECDLNIPETLCGGSSTHPGESTPDLGAHVWAINDEGVIAEGTVGAFEDGGLYVCTEIGLIWTKRTYRTFEEAFAGALVDQLLKGNVEDEQAEQTKAPHLRLVRDNSTSD